RWRIRRAWSGGFRGFLAPPEHHGHASGGIELDDHVRALVRHPDVVLAVDANGVGEGESVQVLPDLSNERAVSSEFEQLCGGRPVNRRAFARAAVHEHVSFRVHCHSRDFTEVQVRGELEEVDTRVESDGGHGLRRRLSAGESECGEQDGLEASHEMDSLATRGERSTYAGRCVAASRARVDMFAFGPPIPEFERSISRAGWG